jgi:hypothetical protein
MTVKELKQNLAQLGSGYDKFPVKIWLPGSKIYIVGRPMCHDNEVLLEGNLEEGSVLRE